MLELISEKMLKKKTAASARKPSKTGISDFKLRCAKMFLMRFC